MIGKGWYWTLRHALLEVHPHAHGVAVRSAAAEATWEDRLIVWTASKLIKHLQSLCNSHKEIIFAHARAVHPQITLLQLQSLIDFWTGEQNQLRQLRAREALDPKWYKVVGAELGYRMLNRLKSLREVHLFLLIVRQSQSAANAGIRTRRKTSTKAVRHFWSPSAASARRGCSVFTMAAGRSRCTVCHATRHATTT